MKKVLFLFLFFGISLASVSCAEDSTYDVPIIHFDNIQEDWSDLQKIAYIDYRIGKKISYTPDFNTEVSNDGAARALWKIIASGYGVCNGIAQIEQYMLKRVGIESEMVSAETHAFLKVTSNFTSPAFLGGKSLIRNLPSKLLSFTNTPSPS